MNARLAVAAGSAALLLATGAVRAADAPQRTITGSAPAAATVSVNDGNGDVRVIGDDGGDVRYTARVFASTAAAANLVAVEQLRDGDRLQLRVRFPDEARGGWWFQHSGVSVDIEVHVPRRVLARASSGNGDVTVNNVAGGVNASSGNGNLRLDAVGGSVTARSGNGDVAIALAPDWHGDGITANSGHGDIHLVVPSGVSLRYSAQSGMGDVHVPASGSGPLARLRSGMGDISAATR